MDLSVKIECDRCTEDAEFNLYGRTMKKALDLANIRELIERKGWHLGSTCLCPSCKGKVGGKNCLNCGNLQYKDFNYRCKLDFCIVSEFDTCNLFWKGRNSD